MTLPTGDVVSALPINIAGKKGETTTLSLRPERVVVNPRGAKYPNVLQGKVEEVIYLGDHIRTRINVAGHDDFIVKIPNSAAHPTLNPGSEVKVGWSVKDCRALDAPAA